MRTKEQIERRLKTLEISLENLKKDGDTEFVERIESQIQILKWVLES
jgi:hypothetical protein